MKRTVPAILALAALFGGCIGDLRPEEKPPPPSRDFESWKTAPREAPTPEE